MTQRTLIILAAAIVAAAGARLAYAQSYADIDISSLLGGTDYSTIIEDINDSGASPITLRAFPELPKPGETVRASVQSYSLDLNQTTVTWTLDGKVVLSGIGQTSYSFVANSAGKQQTLRVAVSAPTGTISQSVSFAPTEVDLIWEARSYVPPFYKGKAPMPYQGQVVITAMPATAVDPNKLIYTWKQDGKVLGPQSGYGKRSVEIKTGIVMRPMDVSVEVKAANGSYSASGKATIEMEQPKILLYNDNRLIGIQYNKAFSESTVMKVPEFTLRAEPFGFSVAEKHARPPVNLVWYVNSIPTRDVFKDSITVRRPNVTGSSNVMVKATMDDDILQSATRAITISF